MVPGWPLEHPGRCARDQRPVQCYRDPGAGRPRAARHVHHREDESFYVLEGNITYYVGEETYEAGTGTFVFLPRGVPHSFTFETETIRMLTVFAPAGIEAHFRDPRFGEPAREPTLPAGAPDIAAFAEDLALYGVEIVGPPGPPERA